MPTRLLVLLFFAVAIFHCLGNWALPLIDRDEPRFAEASREMLQRGDFVVPFFNNRERFDKPALIYWLQAGAYRVLGDHEFAARLPSAVCAALVAVALAAWGARLFDPLTGLRAAIIFSTCLQTLIHARAAVADMAMVLFVTLAAWAGWEWHRAASAADGTRRDWKFCAAFGLALGLGFLAKGPIAWLPLGMLWWSGLSWNSPPRRDGFRPPAPAPEEGNGGAVTLPSTNSPTLRTHGRRTAQWLLVAVIMLAVVSSWGIPALLRTHGAFAEIGLGKHVVARSMRPLEGHGGGGGLASYLLSLPFFFLAVFPSFFPWSIWLPAMVRHFLARGTGRGSIERYLLVGGFLCFAVFTLVRTKLPHYTLPAFPFLALLAALWWRDAARPAETFRRTAIITVACATALLLVVVPLGAQQFPAESLYRQAAPLLRREMSLATVDYIEPSLVWIFRQRIEGFQTAVKEKRLPAWLAQPGPRIAVLSGAAARRLQPQLDPAWPIYHAAGWHPVKGRRIRLALIVKKE